MEKKCNVLVICFAFVFATLANKWGAHYASGRTLFERHCKVCRGNKQKNKKKQREGAQNTALHFRDCLVRFHISPGRILRAFECSRWWNSVFSLLRNGHIKLWHCFAVVLFFIHPKNVAQNVVWFCGINGTSDWLYIAYFGQYPRYRIEITPQ